MQITFDGNLTNAADAFLAFMETYEGRSTGSSRILHTEGELSARSGLAVEVLGDRLFSGNPARVDVITFGEANSVTTTPLINVTLEMRFDSDEDTNDLGEAFFTTRAQVLGATIERDVSGFAPALADFDLDATGGAGADIVRASSLFRLAGDDTIRGLGGADRLDGGRGDDTLDGGWGQDKLRGGADRDILLGGAGNDLLLGGQGRDLLDGGAGNDRLKGGGGRDVFVFDFGGGNDTVYGFRADIDQIALRDKDDAEQIETEIDGAHLLLTLGDATLLLLGGAGIALDDIDFRGI